MNDDYIPQHEQITDNNFTFNWVNLFIGAALCYFWFYESWKSMACLAIVVIIHELGHVVAGKHYGCAIEEMQVFLLAFVTWRPRRREGTCSWRDISWSLGALPLGGFTVFKNRPSESAAPNNLLDVARSLYINDKPAWQRLLISAGGVVFNLATFLLLYLSLPYQPEALNNALWPVMAMSLVLAVLNILPVYPLDGGAILLAAYEMVIRKKPSQRFVNACGMVGMALIILFFWVFPQWVQGIIQRVFGAFF